MPRFAARPRTVNSAVSHTIRASVTPSIQLNWSRFLATSPPEGASTSEQGRTCARTAMRRRRSGDRGGSVWESNPPRLNRALDGFEDRSSHQARSAPALPGIYRADVNARIIRYQNSKAS